ncbi:MAG TPA: pyridoxal-dependent decarboxylase [Vicinamibacterales bacterium]|nr:pyridoxal-dependent decarboxylase [Vicinamibacterales bacterium]
MHKSDQRRATGDMDPDTFRREGHRVVDWIAEYFENPDRYPVMSRVKPGEVRDALPASAPETGEPFEEIFRDFERTIIPGITHWNHPGFFAYFAITASGPGILAEFLAAALNAQGMLWRTSPAVTELEEVALRWLRDLMGLPASFGGVIYDTASVSSLHALAAARQAAVPGVRSEGLAGRPDLPRYRVYCSDQAHSSIDKAVILIGLGHDGLRKIPSDSEFRMRPEALSAAIAEDRRAGIVPLAVVATVGTTSTTSVDPVDAIADICAREGVWLHVDCAYAGVAAIIPEYRGILRGADRADSIVVNPHKWLFTPFDLSAFYCRRMEVLTDAFSLTPEYLRTSEAGTVRNLMDTGVQLGRRFRALKLWALLRYFGAEGIRSRLGEHMRLARLFSSWVDADPDFERLAPVPFSVVCFRARPAGRDHTEDELEQLNQSLLDRVNATGEVFLSHTKLDGRFVLRLAVGNLRTEERHVRRAWDLLTTNARDRAPRGIQL